MTQHSEAEGSPSTQHLSSHWDQFLNEFLKDLKQQGYSALTIRDYRTDIIHLAQMFPDRPQGVGVDQLSAAENDLLRNGRTKAYCRRRVAAWNRYHHWLNSRNQARTVPGFLKGCRTLPLRDQLLVSLVAHAGLRPGEISELEGRDVKLRSGKLITRSGNRVLPIHSRLGDLLDQYTTHIPLVPYRPLLPGPNGFPVNTRTLHARFKRSADRLDLARMQPEVLRRHTASRLGELGTPYNLILVFLGRDRGKALAPRSGGLNDLTCIRDRLERALE